MKVIERPESTTHMLNFPFHLIKNETEAENVKKLIGDRKIMQVHRGITPDTFQPLIYFAIPEEGKTFFEWMKYVAPLELVMPE
jgi:hypothetical protein